jgi:hypothetical protein
MTTPAVPNYLDNTYDDLMKKSYEEVAAGDDDTELGLWTAVALARRTETKRLALEEAERKRKAELEETEKARKAAEELEEKKAARVKAAAAKVAKKAREGGEKPPTKTGEKRKVSTRRLGPDGTNKSLARGCRRRYGRTSEGTRG